MKGGKQKISQDTCLQESRAEPEGYAGGQTFIWMTENNLTNANKPEYGLLEQILSPTNLNRAYKRVRSNRGSGGIDKMEVESLKDYLVDNKETLIQSILDGKYRPNPVRRVEISKEKGTRKLGIPWWIASSSRRLHRSYLPLTRDSSRRTVTGLDPGAMHTRH
jgi:hypothetical protein